MPHDLSSSYSARLPTLVVSSLNHIFISSFFIAEAQATCYFPDGSLADPAKNLFTCNTNTKFSHCCVQGDECTTNGLCKSSAGSNRNWYFRESCTDSTWNSTSCPHYCHMAATGSPSQDWLVFACSDTTYCCSDEDSNISIESNYDCCSNSSNLFTAGAAVRLAGATITTSTFGDSKTSSLSTLTSILSITSAATTPSPSAVSSSTPLSSPFSSNTASSTQQPTPSPRPGLAVGVIIGLAVGIPLGLACLGGLGFFIWRKGKKAGQRKASQNESMVDTYTNHKEAYVDDRTAIAYVVHELDEGNNGAELDSKVISELPGGGRMEGPPKKRL